MGVTFFFLDCLWGAQHGVQQAIAIRKRQTRGLQTQVLQTQVLQTHALQTHGPQGELSRG
jgi:hypothetical protein